MHSNPLSLSIGSLASRVILLVIGLVTVSSLAVAQPRPMDRRGGPDPAADRRAAIKQRIRVLRAATLTEELRLDEKALSRILPTLAKWDDVTEDLLRKRIDIQTRIEAADPAKDPRGVDRLIDEAVANQKSFWDLEEKRLAELRKILTPGQVARLLIVLPNFERRIQNQLRRAMTNASRRGGGPGRGEPLDDDDEDVDPRAQRRGR